MTEQSARAKGRAIGELYRQLDAPDYAATNLDALLDVLRDLSWLPLGEVHLRLPDLSDLSDADRRALLGVIATAVDDSVDTERPLHVDPR